MGERERDMAIGKEERVFDSLSPLFLYIYICIYIKMISLLIYEGKELDWIMGN